MRYQRLFLLHAAAFWAAIATASVGTNDSSLDDPEESAKRYYSEIQMGSDQITVERALELQRLLLKSHAENSEKALARINRAPAVLGPATDTPSERPELYTETIEISPIEPEAAAQ